MKIDSKIKSFLRNTPVRYYLNLIKGRFGRTPQSDESDILNKLIEACAPPRTFVEFGFHPNEYNCIGLNGFDGLLIDGDSQTVKLARTLLPECIEVKQCFITLENIDSIGSHFSQIGILSIDVDGNDYWFLKALLPAHPAIVIVEYNASMGLRPMTVPYDASFSRSEKHDTGWYHGASITAMTNLCNNHGYKLVAVSAGGGNAFFVPLNSTLPELNPGDAYLECALRNRWSGTTAQEQWERIKHLSYVDCS